jgi:hypothetical protein
MVERPGEAGAGQDASAALSGSAAPPSTARAESPRHYSFNLTAQRFARPATTGTDLVLSSFAPRPVNHLQMIRLC